MDEFKRKQTNPYSAQPTTPQEPAGNVPVVQPAPIPTPPQPVAQPQPARPTEEQAKPAPAATPTQQVAQNVTPEEFMSDPKPGSSIFEETPNDEKSKEMTGPKIEPTPVEIPTTSSSSPPKEPQQSKETSIARRNSKFTVIALVVAGFLLISSLAVGGTWYWQQNENKQLESSLEDAQAQVGDLKSRIAGGNTSGPALFGDSNVEGATSESFSEYIFTGDIGFKNDEVLFESFIDMNQLPPVDAVWVNWGGSPDNLDQKSTPVIEDFVQKDGEISVVVVNVAVDKFASGSSYLYQTSVRTDDGNVYKTGYAVFTMPGERKEQSNNQQDQSQPEQSLNPADFLQNSSGL